MATQLQRTPVGLCTYRQHLIQLITCSYICFLPLVSRPSHFLDFSLTLLAAVLLSPLLVPPPPSDLLKLECLRVYPWSSYHFYHHSPPQRSYPVSWFKSDLYANHSRSHFCKTSDFYIKLPILHVHSNILETSPTFPKPNSAISISVKGSIPPVPTPLFLQNPIYNQSTLTADLQSVSRTQPFITNSVWVTNNLHLITSRTC